MTDIPIINNDFDLPNDEHLFGLGNSDKYKGTCYSSYFRNS